MKIAVAVSGGMDSLYALSEMKRAGHEVPAAGVILGEKG